MYSVIPKEQVSDFESFISKIPESKVRSDIERLWDKVVTSGYRIQYEDLDQLKDYSIHLPANLQSFPQSFEHFIKNGDDTDVREAEEKTPAKAKANLGDNVSEAHEGVKVQSKNIKDTSVAPTEDRGNKASLEPHPTPLNELDTDEEVVSTKKSTKKSIMKSTTKVSSAEADTEKRATEAKAGDLNRSAKALEVGTTKKQSDKPKVVLVDKKAVAKSAKKK